MTVTENEALDIVISLHRLTRSLRQSNPQQALQPTQVVVLAALSEFGPSRISTIAELVPCAQPTATSVVSALVDRGLIRREADETDARVVRAAITDDGTRILRSTAHSQAGVLAERLSQLSTADSDLLIGAAEVMRKLVESEGQRSG